MNKSKYADLFIDFKNLSYKVVFKKQRIVLIILKNQFC